MSVELFLGKLQVIDQLLIFLKARLVENAGTITVIKIPKKCQNISLSGVLTARNVDSQIDVHPIWVCLLTE